MFVRSCFAPTIPKESVLRADTQESEGGGLTSFSIGSICTRMYGDANPFAGESAFYTLKDESLKKQKAHVTFFQPLNPNISYSSSQ